METGSERRVLFPFFVSVRGTGVPLETTLPWFVCLVRTRRHVYFILMNHFLFKFSTMKTVVILVFSTPGSSHHRL